MKRITHLPRRRDMLSGTAMHNPDAIDLWAETLPTYDALYRWCRDGNDEMHG